MFPIDQIFPSAGIWKGPVVAAVLVTTVLTLVIELPITGMLYSSSVFVPKTKVKALPLPLSW
jgi:hypothetical protein